MRWVGGKQRLVANITSLLPDKHPKRYFEPFLGGGALFFAHRFAQAELSDINPYLINAYAFVKSDPETVYLRLVSHLVALQQSGNTYYLEQRNLFNYQKTDTVHLEEQAARFIFLIQSNYNGIYRVNSKGEYNVPFGKTITPLLPSLNHLKAASARLQSANLYLRGYDEIVNEVQPGDLVYLDPPYPVLSPTANFTGYTLQRFSEVEQHELAARAQQMVARGAKVLISTAKVDLVEELYPNDQWSYNLLPMKRNLTAKRPAIEVMEIVLASR